MSRPFSYNDENFTVINNMLFVHINIGKEIYQGNDKIIAIPPKILDRMVTYNQYCYCSTKVFNTVGFDAYLSVDENGILWNKNRLSSTSEDKILYSLFLLKDI